VASRNGTVSRIDPRRRKLVGGPTSVIPFTRFVLVGNRHVYALSAPGAYAVLNQNGSPAGASGGDEILRLGSSVDDAVVASGALWVVNANAGRLLRYPLVRGQPEIDARMPLFVGRSVASVAVGAGAVWVVVSDSGLLRRLAPTGTVPTRRKDLRMAPGASEVSVGGAGVWVVSPTRGIAQKVDPSGSRILSSVKTPKCSSGKLTMDDDRVFYLCSDTGTVTTISGGRAGRPRSVATPGKATSIHYADGAVWLTERDTNAVKRIPARQPTP
jgi:hypothetical protein